MHCRRRLAIALGAVSGLLGALAGCGSSVGRAPASGEAMSVATGKSAALAVRDWQASFPSQPGFTWQYDAVAHPTDDPYVDYPGSHTVAIDSAARRSGQTILALRDIDSYTTTYRFPTLVISSGGIDLKGVDYWGPVASPIEDLTVAFLRFPLSVGQRWDDGGWIGKVLKEERITVPAGTFETVEIEAIGTHDHAYTAVGYYWIARGVGVVKSDYSIEGWLIETSLRLAGAKQ